MSASLATSCRRSWIPAVPALFVLLGTAGGQERDAIRGVREQHEAARRTANQLNRDAREEAREQALNQAAADPRLASNVGREGDLRDLYMSSLSNRINETMRVLTIISTLFIPLTFIAGIYGMNFDWEGGAKPLNMPELHWYYGYPACLAAMGATAMGMLVYFYRSGWILRR